MFSSGQNNFRNSVKAYIPKKNTSHPQPKPLENEQERKKLRQAGGHSTGMQAPARPQPQGGAGAEPQPRAAAQQLGLEHLLQQEELVRGMGKGGGVIFRARAAPKSSKSSLR